MQCLHLKDVSIRGAIDTNDENRSVSIRRRRQYKQVNLILRENHYHSAGNLKSLLEPDEICLDVYTSNDSLIPLLQDLPHLNNLYLRCFVGKHCASIKKHAKSLTGLFINDYSVDVNSGDIRFSDKQMNELIETCQLLERLTMPCNGLESLDSVKAL
eukprot:scaffold5744_cov179-Ochromonas_danica.AAC.12